MDTNNTAEIPTAMPRAPADVNALLNRLLDEAEQATPPTSGTESTPLSASTPPPSSPPASPTTAPVSTSSAVSPPSPAAAVPASAAPASAASPLGGVSPLLGNLLANPALLTALPTLVENLSPLLGSFQKSAASGGVSGGGALKGKPYPTDRHTALLCAIKPYLSSQRQEAAETVIRLCRVWDALGRSGISLSGLLSSFGGAVPAAAQPATHEQEVT